MCPIHANDELLSPKRIFSSSRIVAGFACVFLILTCLQLYLFDRPVTADDGGFLNPVCSARSNGLSSPRLPAIHGCPSTSSLLVDRHSDEGWS